MRSEGANSLFQIPEFHGIYVRRLKSQGYDQKSMHIHEMYEIYFAMTDDVAFYVNDVVYHLHIGDMLFLSNSDLHRVSAPHVPVYERYIVSFSLDMVPDQCESLLSCFTRGEKEGHKVTLTAEERQRFIALADAILREGEEQTQPLIGQQIALWQLLLFLCRVRSRHHGQNGTDDNAMHPQIRQVLSYIDENYASGVQLDELSRICNYNTSYLCRLFHQETGFRISDYLTSKRLGQSIRLLRHGESVSSAARLSGFHSDSFFIKVFKKNIGMTPYQYVKLHRNDG